MRLKVSSLTLVLLLLFLESGVSKRHSRKSESPLQEWQKRALEKIQVAAREAGLPDSEWKGITKYDKDVCYTKACLQSALEVMQATNFTVDPCKPNKWLDYACSRRINGVDNINQPERIIKKVEQETKEILDNGLPHGKGDDYLLKEAQTYYYQCKNKAHHDKEDVKDILDYLSENYGEWPFITNRDPGPKFNWLNIVADLNRIERVGYKPLIFNVKMDTSSPDIKLEVGRTSNPISGGDFMKMITRVQERSGKQRPARFDQLKGAQQFINGLSYAVLSPGSQYDMTIAELQQKTDDFFAKNKIKAIHVDWLDFFQRVFNGTDIKVTADSPDVALPFDHIMQILKVVNNHFSSNDSRSVANALNFQLATLLLQESTILLDDLNTFKCTDESGSREDICYARTTEIFGYSLGKTYLSVHYNNKIETPAILGLMSKIQKGYINVIDASDWMENSTKEFLKDKIESIKTYVTEPEWTRDPRKLRKFYSGLEREASKSKKSLYPRNYLAITQWQVEKQRSWAHRLAQATSFKQIHFYDSEWSRYLGNVNAQYHKIMNQVRVEGGIAQSPLFGADRPGFMNFGGLGMVLGHEIGHSFDTFGRKYNKDGVGPKEFWDKKSVERYTKWIESILKDYGKEAHQITETSAETVDPVKTLNEDISDILGVFISYNSYQEYLQELENEGKTEKILPGLKSFPPQKLFYMKYANMWCDKKPIQDRFNDLLSDHSSGNTRATLPLKRSQQFAETFGCPVPEQFFSTKK